MKAFVLGAICAGALALCQSVKADVAGIGIGNDIAKNDVGSSPAQIFTWLSGLNLDPAPSNANVQNFEDLNGVGPDISISGPSYVVLHYGVGNGGVKGSGGGLVALFLSSPQIFSVPDNGSGPNGFGGISFARVFSAPSGSPSVPDGGATLPLLGMGAAGLLGLARFQKSRTA